MTWFTVTRWAGHVKGPPKCWTLKGAPLFSDTAGAITSNIHCICLHLFALEPLIWKLILGFSPNKVEDCPPKVSSKKKDAQVCPHQACTIIIISAYDMEHRKFALFGQWVSSCWSCSQVWNGNETKTSVLFSCQDDVFKASVWTIWEGHGHPTQFLHLELFAGCLRKRHAHGRISQHQQEQVVHLKASRILTVQAGQCDK